MTLSTSMAYFIGIGFAEWLAGRLRLPLTSLRVSVRPLLLLTQLGRVFAMQLVPSSQVARRLPRTSRHITAKLVIERVTCSAWDPPAASDSRHVKSWDLKGFQFTQGG